MTHDTVKKTRRKPQGSKPERPVRSQPLGAAEGEKGNTGSVLVRVTSLRSRLIDPDNLTPKYFIDCCRYCGWIEDDTASHVSVETRQEKVSKEEEATIVEIIQL